MGRKLSEIFLGNVLIVLALIPMVICLNSLTEMFPYPIFWTIVSILLLLAISYLTYKYENKK